MLSLPIRARIAPVALLVAFAFVVVGFLRADREMAKAEEDRVDLIASETAILVEVFLLRHQTELHFLEHRLTSADEIATGDSLTTLFTRATPSNPTFGTVWLVDSMLIAHPFSSLRSEMSGRLDIAQSTMERVVNGARRNSGSSIVVDSNQAQSKLLFFVEPLRGQTRRTLVGVVNVDSLAGLLRRQHRVAPFNLLIQSGSDTVLSVTELEAGSNLRSIQRPIAALGVQWTVLIGYAPSGRGVRIALWVVGLGAIVGLGVGLLLERREASRIADRSSELEHLSTELLRANRAKSEFLANVSHELRTPLNAIVGFVDLLRDGVYGTLNSRQAGPVERIEASANHLRHLVDQVLDLAKMAAGRLEVHTEPLELRPFVFDVASEVEPLIAEKGLSLSLAVGATLPRIRTDPTHLRQILINLLGNAVKFTADGGISIRGKIVGSDKPITSSPGRLSSITAQGEQSQLARVWIALQVADSGIGIPPKDCERIFDEFEQVNAGPRGDSMRRGTGLGLSISRRLARLLGGDITVESELGRGSVFTVWLPVDPADLRGDQAE